MYNGKCEVALVAEPAVDAELLSNSCHAERTQLTQNTTHAVTAYVHLDCTNHAVGCP